MLGVRWVCRARLRVVAKSMKGEVEGKMVLVMLREKLVELAFLYELNCVHQRRGSGPHCR